jgi:hypothetical protein
VGLYFGQEVFLIVSEIYKHSLLANNKMESNAKLIKWKNKTRGYESVQNTGKAHSVWFSDTSIMAQI